MIWLGVLYVPLGGFLADRTKSHRSFLVIGCALFAGLMFALPRIDAVIWMIVALGLVCGQPAGAIISLPARVLEPSTRAIGMGLFYTIYYGAMMLGPIVAGAAAKWTGSAAAAFDFGALVLLLCPLLLSAFNTIAARTLRTTAIAPGPS